MRAAVAHDKSFSDRYIPALQRIAGELLVSVAPLQIDREENTDLLVLTLKAQRIACRVRRPDAVVRYAYDVTFRTERPSGSRTEWQKMLIDRFGDLMLYGFGDDLGHVFRWVALALDPVRGAVASQLMAENEAHRKRRPRPAPLMHGPFTTPNGERFLSLDVRDDRIRPCVVGCSPGFWDAKVSR